MSKKKDPVLIMIDIADKITINNYIAMWKKYFYIGANKLGFSQHSIDLLFEWGEGGHNWELLNCDTRHKYYTKSALISDLKYEMSYIADRLSIDRLFRAHWLFNQIHNKELQIKFDAEIKALNKKNRRKKK